MDVNIFASFLAAFNNVCNFLVALNAACNFLLYCALSNKYRKTVRDLFIGRRPNRQNTINSSRFSRYSTSQTTNTSGGSSVRHKSPYSFGSSIRMRSPNAATAASAKPSKPNRFTISPTDYVNFQAEMAKQQAKTQHLSACDFMPSSVVSELTI